MALEELLQLVVEVDQARLVKLRQAQGKVGLVDRVQLQQFLVHP
jgi:hypothetical protein